MARQKYTYERLAAAAANSTSISELMRYLGAPLEGGSTSHVRKRLSAFEIDTSHFRRRKYTAELLAEAAANSDSVAGVLRYLGLIWAGGTHAHISRMLKQLEIDTSHFRRNQGGRAQVSRRVAPTDLLVADPSAMRRQKPQRLRRALLEIGRAYVCAWCGCCGLWRGKPLTLHVDHINGDFRDNRAENLRFLCPNCHAQTENFAGASKGRYSRLSSLPELAGVDEARASLD